MPCSQLLAIVSAALDQSSVQTYADKIICIVRGHDSIRRNCNKYRQSFRSVSIQSSVNHSHLRQRFLKPAKMKFFTVVYVVVLALLASMAQVNAGTYCFIVLLFL